jgi:hypothetical protein
MLESAYNRYLALGLGFAFLEEVKKSASLLYRISFTLFRPPKNQFPVIHVCPKKSVFS